MYPDIPGKNELENFDWQGSKLDTVSSKTQPGDVVLPIEVAQHNPDLVMAVQLAIAQGGGDPDAYIAGSQTGNYNPVTGQQHFFLKKMFKKALPIVAPIAGFAFGGPAGAALAGGLATKATGGSWKQALTAGALSGLGARFMGGGSSFGNFLGKAGGSAGFGGTLARGAATGINMLGPGATSAIMGASMGGMAGAALGGWAGSQRPKTPSADGTIPTWDPSQQVDYSGYGGGYDNSGQMMMMMEMMNQQNMANQQMWGNMLPFMTQMPQQPQENLLPMPDEQPEQEGQPQNYIGERGVAYLQDVPDRYSGEMQKVEVPTPFSSNLMDRRQGFGGTIQYV